MRTITLDTSNYIVGDAVYNNVLRCLPAPVKQVFSRRWESEILVDEPNKRIYMIETEVGRMNESVPGMHAVVEECIQERKEMLKGTAQFGRCRLLDYDIYLIAAAEYEGQGPWYQFLGGTSLFELFSENIEVAPGVTFSYVVLPYFDKEKYLKEYDSYNHPCDTLLDKLPMMEKYIYQRTKIDLDFHNYGILDYQDECDIEPLLASVNWFRDGKPTIYTNDEEFLAEWDMLEERLKPYRHNEALAMIRTGTPLWDIDATVYMDTKYDGEPSFKNTKDYIPMSIDGLLHVVFTLQFGKRFKGNMHFEILHRRSGYAAKWKMIPPKQEYIGSGSKMTFATQGVSLSQILSKDYKHPDDSKDYVTVKLYHCNKEIFKKNFLIKRIGS